MTAAEDTAPGFEVGARVRIHTTTPNLLHGRVGTVIDHRHPDRLPLVKLDTEREPRFVHPDHLREL